MRKSIKKWFPIKEIKDGIIETKDEMYIKILEVVPINFELKSNFEKESIIYQYKTFLKTCDFDIQILIQSKKNELNKHIDRIIKINEDEKAEKLNELVKEYIKNVQEKTLKTTITRRFFIVFGAEINRNKKLQKDVAIDDLKEKTLKIKKILEKCGNEVIDFSDDDKKIIENLYKQLNRSMSYVFTEKKAYEKK